MMIASVQVMGRAYSGAPIAGQGANGAWRLCCALNRKFFGFRRNSRRIHRHARQVDGQPHARKTVKGQNEPIETSHLKGIRHDNRNFGIQNHSLRSHSPFGQEKNGGPGNP